MSAAAQPIPERGARTLFVCPGCGSLNISEVCNMLGTSGVSGFTRDDKGDISPDYSGESEAWWESSEHLGYECDSYGRCEYASTGTYFAEPGEVCRLPQRPTRSKSRRRCPNCLSVINENNPPRPDGCAWCNGEGDYES